MTALNDAQGRLVITQVKIKSQLETRVTFTIRPHPDHLLIWSNPYLKIYKNTLQLIDSGVPLYLERHLRPNRKSYFFLKSIFRLQ